MLLRFEQHKVDVRLREQRLADSPNALGLKSAMDGHVAKFEELGIGIVQHVHDPQSTRLDRAGERMLPGNNQNLGSIGHKQPPQ
jgi:hypothetical protein